MTLPLGLQRTASYSRHAKELLRERMGGPPAPMPADIPHGMQVELQNIVGAFREALQNRVELPFRIEDVREVLESNVRNKDEVLRSRFPGPFPENSEHGTLKLLTKPTVFLDQDERIVGCFLPNIFTLERSEHVYESVKALSRAPGSVLAESRAKRRNKACGKSWRNDNSVFRAPASSTMTPGNVVMSICWYNQGWGPRNERPPAPSADLRPFGGGPEFLKSECDTNALIGVVLSLIHPRLYDLQMEVLRAIHDGKVDMQQPQHVERLFNHWSTPFTAFALISNRETPLHRDTKGGKMLLDILATFGRYTGGRFEVPLFGARFVYNPSTVLIFPGHLLQHGASEADGERVCMASFFRPNVGYGALPYYQELPPATLMELVDNLGIARPM